MIPGSASAEDDADWEQELPRIRLCCQYGSDLHDDLVWIVLKSTSISQGIDPEMAIKLLEHLFEKCGRNRKGSLNVSDPHLVWELYNLVQYTPDAAVTNSDTGDSKGDSSQGGGPNGKDSPEVPR